MKIECEEKRAVFGLVEALNKIFMFFSFFNLVKNYDSTAKLLMNLLVLEQILMYWWCTVVFSKWST